MRKIIRQLLLIHFLVGIISITILGPPANCFWPFTKKPTTTTYTAIGEPINISDIDDGFFEEDFNFKCLQWRYNEPHLIGDRFMVTLRRFHCLCGERTWCSNATLRKIKLNIATQGYSISHEIVGRDSLGRWTKWNRANYQERMGYTQDSIIHLPWCTTNNDNEYIIMQCNNNCVDVRNAINSWENELKRLQLADSISNSSSDDVDYIR